VKSWLDGRDAPGSYDADYHCLVVDGGVAVTQGRTRYHKPDGSVDKEYDNIFVLEFDEDLQCREFREWYMSPRRRA
jgi:hypothetical protein